MYLKVEQSSLIYGKLSAILKEEGLRNIRFHQWQVKNLPKFDGKRLIQNHPWYMYPNVVAWKFTGEVDPKTWQATKGWDGYYEPNRRTKAGKDMRKKIIEAQGKRFNRLDFFDLFQTHPSLSREIKVPNGFIYHDIIYMEFGDECYKDISTKLAGQYTEITNSEWDEVCDAYMIEQKNDLRY